MFNTIRQYLAQNYQLGSNSTDNYRYPDNWRQQRNRHVGNWLTDMAVNQHQPFYEKDNRQNFWGRGRKKKQYYDPARQPFNNSMYYHNAYSNQSRLKNKSSHKSLSSLFHRHRDEDDYGRNHYQQGKNNGLGSQYTSHSSPKTSYRRQRHHSLPSSSKNPLNHHQPFMGGAAPNSGLYPVINIGFPVLTAAATAAGNQIGGMLAGKGGGGFGNPLLPQHHHQQLQQQQRLQQQQQQQPYYNRQSMPMQGQHYNDGMFDHYSQHGPYDGSPPQSQHHSDQHHFSSLFGKRHNSHSRHHYEPDHHSLDNSPYSNSYHSPEQQHILNYYHQQQQQQQQQQHHAYPYINVHYGGGGGYPLQNNQKSHG